MSNDLFMIHIIKCPYCDSSNLYSNHHFYENFKIYTQPGGLLSDYTKFFWWFTSPNYVYSENKVCCNCKENINFVIFTYSDNDFRDVQKSPLWSVGSYYYKMLINEDIVIDKRPMHEKAIDCLLDLRHALSSENFVGLLFLILIILAYGGLSLSIYTSHSFTSIFQYIMIIILLVTTLASLWLLSSYTKKLRDILNCNALKLDLSEAYKRSRSCHIFEESNLKSSIFGHTKVFGISRPTLFALVFVSILFYESPQLLTPYLSIPYNVLMAFLISTFMWYIFASLIIFFNSIYCVKINPLKRSGGIKIYGDLFILSINPITAFLLGFDFALLFIIISGILSMPSINILLALPLFEYILYISIPFILFVIFHFIILILPTCLKMYHKKKQELSEIEKILNNSDLTIEDIKDETRNISLHNNRIIKLLSIYPQISSMHIMPFELNVWGALSIMVTILSSIITILKFTYPYISPHITNIILMINGSK